MIYNNLLETVGNTPIVKLNKCVPKGPHTFWAKLEFFNPGGSVKDRIGISIIEEAEKRGELKPGGTIIEATSGNTGLGLALVAAIKGYKTIFVMPDKISEEKRSILRAYGAKVIITPTAVEPEDPRSFYSVAKKLVEITPNSFYANQYHNPDNPTQHYRTTGPEIWKQSEGKVDVLVGGAGTGGTLSGTGRYLKEQKPSIKVVCADPVGSILYDLFHFKEVREPAAPYKVEGVGEDMLPSNVHMDVFDDFIKVTDKESFTMVRDILAQEGICAGPSSALALVGAIKFSQKLTKPSNILVVFPDNGRAYLSKAFNDAWLKEHGFVSSVIKEKTVADLLTARKKSPDIVSARVNETVMEVVNKMKKHGVSQLPVYSDGEIVGILDESDLLEPLVRGWLKPHEPIIHLVKGSIIWCKKDDALNSLIDQFKDGYVALIKEGEKLHIITKIDLLEYLGEVQ